MEKLAASMINYGSTLHDESEYGKAVIKFGQAHEQIATTQHNFATSIQAGYMGEISKIILENKEYTRLKSKLENRRLDFDAKLNKVQKSKKENSVLEEETRVSQAKYEEVLIYIDITFIK